MADTLAKLDDKVPPPLRQVPPALQPLITYALMLGLVTLVFLLRAWLAPTLGNQALYLFLVPPVLIAGIVGGLGPGLVSTAYAMALQIFVTGDLQSLLDIQGSLFIADTARAVTFGPSAATRSQSR